MICMQTILMEKRSELEDLEKSRVDDKEKHAAIRKAKKQIKHIERELSHG